MTLADLNEGQEGVLDRIEMPDDEAQRLKELGFLPGATIRAARRAPFGGPKIFQVDGSVVALRPGTARRMILRADDAVPGTDDGEPT